MPGKKRQYLDQLVGLNLDTGWDQFFAKHDGAENAATAQEPLTEEELNDLIEFAMDLTQLAFSSKSRIAQTLSYLQHLKTAPLAEKRQVQEVLDQAVAQLAMTNFVNARADLEMTVGPAKRKVFAKQNPTAAEKQKALYDLLKTQKDLLRSATILVNNELLGSDGQQQTQAEISRAQELIEKLPNAIRNNIFELAKLAWEPVHSTQDTVNESGTDLLEQRLYGLLNEGRGSIKTNAGIIARQAADAAVRKITDGFFPNNSDLYMRSSLAKALGANTEPQDSDLPYLYVEDLDRLFAAPGESEEEEVDTLLNDNNPLSIYQGKGNLNRLFTDVKDLIDKIDALRAPGDRDDMLDRQVEEFRLEEHAKVEYFQTFRDGILRILWVLGESTAPNATSQDGLVYTNDDLNALSTLLQQKIAAKLGPDSAKLLKEFTPLEPVTGTPRESRSLRAESARVASSRVSSKAESRKSLYRAKKIFAHLRPSDSIPNRKPKEPLVPEAGAKLETPNLVAPTEEVMARRIGNIARHFNFHFRKNEDVRPPSPTIESDSEPGALIVPESGVNLIDYLRSAFRPDKDAAYLIKKESSRSIYKRHDLDAKKDHLVCTIKASKKTAPGAVTIEFNVSKGAMSYYESIKPLLIATKMKAEAENKPLSNFMLDLPELKSAEHAQQLFLAIYDVFRPTVAQLDQVGEGVDVFANIIRLKSTPGLQKAFSEFCSEGYENATFKPSLAKLFTGDDANEVISHVTAARRLFVTHAEQTILQDYTPPPSKNRFSKSRL